MNRVLESKRFFMKFRESMIAWLLKLQQKNAFVVNQQYRQRFAVKKNELSKWKIEKNELLRRDLAIYVSNDFATKNEILRMNHDDSNVEHFARSRTMKVIRRKYYWQDMTKNITNYVRICSNCQRVRVHHHKSYEQLKLISSSDVNSFHIVTMNFIIDMSSTKNSYTNKTNDAILVLIDKLIKYAIYISTNKSLNAKRFVDLMWREFINQNDMMRNIISNRDSLFTSKFWSILCWHLDAKRRLSTAFHSQTNDQTKRQNQVLKHYLRVYCNYKQNNWSKLLSMTMFAYNNSVHSAIDKALNVMLKEYIAIFANASENKISREETSLIAERAQWLRSIKEYLKDLWERVSKQQVDYYNSNHTAMHFEVSSKIFLRSVNIRIMRFKKKIDHKQLRFFVILKRVNTQTYKLDLSIKYDAIHSIFHVSLLKS